MWNVDSIVLVPLISTSGVFLWGLLLLNVLVGCSFYSIFTCKTMSFDIKVKGMAIFVWVVDGHEDMCLRDRVP